LNKNTAVPPSQNPVARIENGTVDQVRLIPSTAAKLRRWRYEIKFYAVYKFVYTLVTRLTASLFSLLPPSYMVVPERISANTVFPFDIKTNTNLQESSSRMTINMEVDTPRG